MPHTPALLVIAMQNALMGIAHRPVVTVRQGDEELVPGTEGWRVVPEPAPREGEAVVDKTTPDSFRDTDLDGTLKDLGATELIMTGFATEVCVDTTARQALSRVAADGHTTSLRGEADAELVPADRSIARYNAIYRTIGWPGRRIRVRAAADVEFTAPEGAGGLTPA
jgi:nicotinamidase-related amidase